MLFDATDDADVGDVALVGLALGADGRAAGQDEDLDSRGDPGRSSNAAFERHRHKVAQPGWMRQGVIVESGKEGVDVTVRIDVSPEEQAAYEAAALLVQSSFGDRDTGLPPSPPEPQSGAPTTAPRVSAGWGRERASRYEPQSGDTASPKPRWAALAGAQTGAELDPRAYARGCYLWRRFAA